ncbi:radical SAM protein [Candidatus Woesearchaeota archaeon]|nr:radical SAM protein [Candidatus Woesearchaeota archaeon]
MKEKEVKKNKGKKKKSSNVFSNYREVKSKRAIEWEKTRPKAYSEYRKRWVEYPKELKIPGFPMHMDLEASSFCNLSCPFCARTIRVKKGTWRENKHFDLGLFKKIIDEGAREGLCAINLNNYGEPLLNPHIVEMVAYAKSKGILDVFFHTNGVLLSRKMSKRLIAAGLDRIVISFDTPYKEKYEQLRVGARYEQVLDNIKGLFDERKKLKSITPLIRINMIQFPDLTEKEMGDMKKNFLPICDSIGLLALDDYLKTTDVEFKEGYKSKFICAQIISRLTIFENGDVMPCCMDIDGELKLGNAKTSLLKDLWNSKKLKGLRDSHFKGEFYKVLACRRCEWAIKEDLRLRKEQN